MFENQRHRFSSSNLEDRSVTTDDPQFVSNPDRQRSQKAGVVHKGGASYNKLASGHSQNLNIKQMQSEKPYGD